MNKLWFRAAHLFAKCFFYIDLNISIIFINAYCNNKIPLQVLATTKEALHEILVLARRPKFHLVTS